VSVDRRPHDDIGHPVTVDITGGHRDLTGHTREREKAAKERTVLPRKRLDVLSVSEALDSKLGLLLAKLAEIVCEPIDSESVEKVAFPVGSTGTACG